MAPDAFSDLLQKHDEKYFLKCQPGVLRRIDTVPSLSYIQCFGRKLLSRNLVEPILKTSVTQNAISVFYI